MKVGIPKGLMYCKYHPFIVTFFSELGAEIIVSEDTNKNILDAGVKYCVDDACLPVKIFHGHIDSIKDKCDILVIPRIMQLWKNEYICPKFCGLPEMVINSFDRLPVTITEPIYATSKKKLYCWAKTSGKFLRKNNHEIKRAFVNALNAQKDHKTGIDDSGYEINITLTGHPYNIYDSFLNMNLINKINKLGMGIKTAEFTEEDILYQEAENLYKRPFWTFVREIYGFALNAAKEKKADGIIYVSSFNCGTDSVIIELIKNSLPDFPFLILKIDEHTGEAGINTRIEAFRDMLERRLFNESHISTLG
ncbi:MAG: 2-hydroxyglutaryl-CoA dehydratase [Tissierellia bacterium]|jgi:predicted nucleotide-binding protein (sugar kinase/HSP70/actin superfamily)|nr:2-hydroxyglutaryl-CoA dehydratase [Tissierellia bacterium]